MKCRGKRPKIKIIDFLLLAFYFCLVLTVACGKKGDPRAPELAMPQPIKDLRAEAGAGGAALTWSRPTRFMDGKELRDLAGFVIFRKEVPASCPECPSPYRERAIVNVEDQEKFMKTKRFRFIDQELTPKSIYRYRVLIKLSDGSLSEPSNDAEITWRPQ
jgi:hypothetical protein